MFWLGFTLTIISSLTFQVLVDQSREWGVFPEWKVLGCVIGIGTGIILMAIA